jgi:hypothetical protein
MILHWLHHLPDVGILAVTVIALTGLTGLAPHFGQRLLRLPEDGERDAAAFGGFKAVLSITGLVLAFSLVQANGNLREVSATVAREGATLSMTDRVLLRFGKPEMNALRPDLVEYGKNLIAEWPSLTQGVRSETADAAYTVISNRVRAITPDDARQQAMYRELVADLDDLSDLREQVLADSGYGLPRYFWIAIACLIGLGVGLAVAMTGSLARTIAVAAPAAAIALLLAIVFIIDLPFEGETSVTPEAIQDALTAIAHRS